MMIPCLSLKNNQNLTSILLSYPILILILNLQNSRRKLIKKFHKINQKRNRSSISINFNQSTKTIYNLKGFRLKILSTSKSKGRRMLDNKFSFRIGLQVMSILSISKDISSYLRDNTLEESIGKINKSLKVWQNNSY